jgi:hypothetical protein
MQSTSAAWGNARHVLSIFISMMALTEKADASPSAAAAFLAPAPAALQLILAAYELLQWVHKQLL